MENDASPGNRDGSAEEVLRGLEADRTALAGRMAAPGWIHVAFALVAAGYVLLPVFDDGVRDGLLPFLLVVVLALIWYQRSVTGIRAGAVGAPAWGVFLVTVVAILALVSVSFALVASLSPWWAAVPAAVCFVVVLSANRWFERLSREHVRRGR